MGDYISYLIEKYKGVYRLHAPYNLDTNQFSRKLNGTYEDIDVYIDCKHGNKVFHYGGNKLQAYIPSILRGRNIIKKLEKEYGTEIIFDIEETDEEALFKFKAKDDDKVIPLLKPKVSGAAISPFSAKNLPVNKTYKIPDNDLYKYKEIVQNIPKESLLATGIVTQRYIKTLITKRNKWEDIKTDMARRGLKGKEYIHSIGKWDEYIHYLKTEVEKMIDEKSC